jgi:hypothetical protein
MAEHNDPYHRRGLRLNPFAYGDAELDAAGSPQRSPSSLEQSNH